MNAARARGGLVAVLFGAIVLSSCAPPPPGSLESLELTARRAAEGREKRFAAFESRGALRIDGRATGRLPAVNMHVRAALPDRVRLQAGWLLGMLGDAAVHGDSLTVWMPGERLGFTLAGLADTLGVREPARFLVRALVAGWIAPHEAWRQAALDSAGVQLAWVDGDEHWTLRADRDGRPRDVSVARGEHIVRARYDRWRGSGPAAWPARIELADGDGWVQLRLDLEDLHPSKRPRASWFAIRLPDDARRLELDDVKRILSAARGLR